MTQISFNGPNGMDGPQHHSLKHCQNHCGIIGGLKGVTEIKTRVCNLPGADRVHNFCMCPPSSWNRRDVYWQEPQPWHAAEASLSDLEPWCPIVMCGHIQCDDKSLWQGSNSGSRGIISRLVSVRELVAIMSIYIRDPDHQISSHGLFPIRGPKEWCLCSACLSNDKTSILSH